MKIWMGTTVVATALAFSAPAAIAGTKPAPQAKATSTSDATDLSARRVYRRAPVYAVAPPTYFARPYYYRPYPYALPAPFFLGFGYLPYY
jgi:hypothetical protein